MSAQLMIENLDSRNYKGYFRSPVPGKNQTVINTVNIVANTVTRVDQDAWDAVTNSNSGKNVINDMLQQQRIIVVGGAELSKENKYSHSMREISYQKFVGVYKQINQSGGKANEEVAPFLDANGLPNFEIAKHNVGNINKQQYDQFVSRITKELGGGMHTKALVIPGELVDKTAKVDKSTLSEETGPSYDSLLADLIEKMPALEEEGGIGRRGPKKGVLKAAGFELSKDQEKHLWGMYLKTQED